MTKRGKTTKKKTTRSEDELQARAALIRTVCGLAMSIFAVFALISCLSYVFTWQNDQSLLSNPEMMKESVDVDNVGGKSGFLLARFFMGGFGFGAFALVVLMFAVSVKLLGQKWKWGWLRTALICLSGAFVVAVVCSFFGQAIGHDTPFGSGYGGYCGHATASWLINRTGWFVSFLIVVFSAVVWLVFTSRKFAAWISGPHFERFERKERFNDRDDRTKRDCEDREYEPEIRETTNFGTVAHSDYNSDYQDDRGEELQDDLPFDEPVIVQQPSYPSSGRVQTRLDTDDMPDAAGAFQIVDTGGYQTNVTKELPRIDIREELPKFCFPSIDLLDDYATSQHPVSKVELESNNSKIRSTLLNYKIQVESVTAVVGPTVTLYKVVPSKGVKIANIKNIESDIAMSLGASGVRVVTLKDSVGIEVANETRSIVPLKSMFNAPRFRDTTAELPVAIGYTIQQEVKTFDLANAPHLLVAGATQQGKSVGLNVIIASLLYKKHPSELKFVFIDPKMVEFTSYRKLIKHYLAVLPTACDADDEMSSAIVKKPKQADDILKSLCEEMDQRYLLLSSAGVNKVKDYNEKFKDRHLLPTEGHRYLPYLVVVVDEFADLAMSGGNGPEGKAISRSVSTSIIRLAQKGRAAGIHVIIATQRPSVDVVTSQIKANFPMRIAFRVANRFDSSTILDAPGAEKLIGRGDMLFYEGVVTERVQCAMVDMKEINRITDFIGSQDGYKQCYNTPYYLPLPPADGESAEPGMVDMSHLDSKFEEAARLIVTTQKGSTSDLQRKLGVGFAKAGRIMDQLEAAGIVGPSEGSKARQVLVADLAELEGILSSFLK